MLPTELRASRVQPSPEITGEVRYHRGVAGSGLKYPRDIVVWLPPSYQHNTETRYPVLYAHDGQNLIDPATSFLGCDWRLDETATRLIQKKRIREFILVAIYNTPHRQWEYSGSKTGRNFTRFVVQELKPLIDETYRSLPDRDNTTVIGSSMGGLISFLFSWWHPDVFSQAACLSSSFFWDHRRTIREVRAYNGPKKKIRIYLDVGSNEPFLIPGYHEMVDLLKQKGYRKGFDLEYHYDRGAEHNERAWGKRIWRPLQFLFSV